MEGSSGAESPQGWEAMAVTLFNITSATNPLLHAEGDLHPMLMGVLTAEIMYYCVRFNGATNTTSAHALMKIRAAYSKVGEPTVN